METYELSTEFQPQFGGPVHAVAVFDDNHIVTGGGDRSAIVWKRAGDSKVRLGPQGHMAALAYRQAGLL